MTTAIVQKVGEDTTIILPCRAHDHVAWVRGRGLLNDASKGADILDFWEMKAGETVSITNRFEDLPEWFELHPTEARNRAAYALLRRIESGYEAGEICDGPNVWRVEAGDKLAWVGPARPGYDSNGGVLLILDFFEYCLVAGNPKGNTMEDWQFFGAPSSEDANPDAVSGIRNALETIRALGMPSSLRLDGWGLSW